MSKPVISCIDLKETVVGNCVVGEGNNFPCPLIRTSKIVEIVWEGKKGKIVRTASGSIYRVVQLIKSMY
jgi:hypothetical protein